VGYYLPITDLASDPTIPDHLNGEARLAWIRKHAEFSEFNELKKTVEEWDATKALLGVGGGFEEEVYTVDDFGEEEAGSEEEDEEPRLAGFFSEDSDEEQEEDDDE